MKRSAGEASHVFVGTQLAFVELPIFFKLVFLMTQTFDLHRIVNRFEVVQAQLTLHVQAPGIHLGFKSCGKSIIRASKNLLNLDFRYQI